MNQEKIIVLRTIRHGESDLIIHGLAPNGAKIGFFARSALKSKKRFGGGVLEPTHYIQVQYKASRSEEGLHILEEAQLLQSFSALRKNYDRLETALYLLSLVDRVSKEGDLHSEGLFNLLGHALIACETTKNLSLLRLHFQIKFLAHQGVLSAVENSTAFLRAKLQEHEGVQIEEQNIPKLRSQIQYFLESYLG